MAGLPPAIKVEEVPQKRELTDFPTEGNLPQTRFSKHVPKS